MGALRCAHFIPTLSQLRFSMAQLSGRQFLYAGAVKPHAVFDVSHAFKAPMKAL